MICLKSLKLLILSSTAVDPSNIMAGWRRRSRSPRSGPRSSTQAPWASANTKAMTDPDRRLNSELMDLCAYLRPKPADISSHQEVIARVTNVVQGLWPLAEVRLFGSLETGLWVPGSDIDLTILMKTGMNVVRYLHQLGDALQRSRVSSYLMRIPHARVPIIKMNDRVTGIQVDISFNQENALRGIQMTKQYLVRYPEVRYLVPVLKYFLKQKGLNDTHSGGVGSFLLLCMAIAAVQQSGNPDLVAGHYLLKFLHMFSEGLDFEREGVSIVGQGTVFSKRAKGWTYSRDRALLALESPLDPEHDLGKNSYRIRRVSCAFAEAYRAIRATRGPTPLSGLFLGED